MAGLDHAIMNRIIPLCYVGWAFDFYDLALFSFLLTAIGPEFGLSPTQESWLLGTALGASGLGGLFFGWLADRWGRRPLMTWTILLYSLGTALSALTHSFPVFFALRFIAGLGIGGEWAIGHALVAESVPADRRGRAAALLQSGEPVGVAMAAVAGLLIMPHTGWRAVTFVSGLTALWAIVVRRYLPESTLWQHATEQSRAREWIRSPEGIWTFLRAWGLATFKLGTYWTCYIWLPKFFITRFHEPIARSALWILSAQAGQFFGMLLFGRLADRYGRREAYTVYSILSALALASLALGWESLLQNRPLFWVTMLGLGVGSGCTAGFGSLLSELFPTEVRNLGMGAAYNLARGMQLFAPPLVAFFFLRWDITGALGVPWFFALLTAAWVWTLPDTRKRDLGRILAAET
jgi:MFS family permease